MTFLQRTLLRLRRVALPSIGGRRQRQLCSSPAKGFAAAMAEALEKLEQKKETLKMEREKSEENVKAIKELKRKLKRRKWVEWQYKDEESSSSGSKEKVAKADNGLSGVASAEQGGEEQRAADCEQKTASDSGQRIKRRKFAMLLGYSGAKYYGMQRNPGMDTIEEELFKAMRKHQWITEESFEASQVICFQRAARTDKGVSAARQVCSIKLPENLDVEALNQDLPEDIRLFALERVTKSFNSKDRCDARTYTYTMPTISFSTEEINSSLIVDANGAAAGDAEESPCRVRRPTNYETFRLSQDKWKLVEYLLKKFEGTKNFHNFTSRKNYFDPSAKRFIMSFTCTPSFLSPQGLEFMTLKVKGQSFMLHQIRKMGGLVLAIARGLCDESLMERAFAEEKINLPRAPGLGLVLDTVHYDRYNQRFGSDGIHRVLTWTEHESLIEKFIEERIYSSIYDIEYRETPMISWLVEHLAKHNFDVSKEQDDNEAESAPAAEPATASALADVAVSTAKECPVLPVASTLIAVKPEVHGISDKVDSV